MTLFFTNFYCAQQRQKYGLLAVQIAVMNDYTLFSKNCNECVAAVAGRVTSECLSRGVRWAGMSFRCSVDWIQSFYFAQLAQPSWMIWSRFAWRIGCLVFLFYSISKLVWLVGLGFGYLRASSRWRESTLRVCSRWRSTVACVRASDHSLSAGSLVRWCSFSVFEEGSVRHNCAIVAA